MLRSVKAAVVVIVVACHPVAAQPSLGKPDVEKAVQTTISDMMEEGFPLPALRKSLLGRIVITAQKGPVIREVVVNPNSGEIMRDFSRTLDNTMYAGGSENTSGSGQRPAAAAVEIGDPGPDPAQPNGGGTVDYSHPETSAYNTQ